MTKICVICGKLFDPEDAADEFDSYFDEDGYSYSEMYDDDTCASCAISETESAMPEGADMLGWLDDDN